MCELKSANTINGIASFGTEAPIYKEPTMLENLEASLKHAIDRCAKLQTAITVLKANPELEVSFRVLMQAGAF